MGKGVKKNAIRQQGITCVPVLKKRAVHKHPWLFMLVVLLPAISLVLSLVPANAQTPTPQSDEQLRVVTKSAEPFVIVGEDGSLSGFSIDLWESIAARLGLEFEWIIVDGVTEQIQALESGVADVAISAITITSEREKQVDFSYPYFDAGLRILVRAHAGDPTLIDVLRNIFSPSMFQILGGSLLVLLVMAHMIWLVERGYNPEMPKPYLSGVWEAFWWSITVFTTQEYGEGEEPSSFFRRLLSIFWVVLGLILLAQFTASITSSLTVRQLDAEIHGPEDLPGKRIVTVSDSTASSFLEEHNLEFTTVTRITDAYPLLKRGEVDAIVFDSPVLIHWADSQGEDFVEIAGPLLTEETYGIALPLGSPWRKQINAVILNMQQDGTYDEKYEKWFGNQK